MTSISSFSSSLITLQFSLELNIDIAEQEVQAAINAAGTFLPTNLPIPPVYSKSNPADAPILTLAVTSRTLPLPKVEELAETRMAQRISQLKGVGLVSISGGQRPAVRVQANPVALAAYGLSMETLRTALAQYPDGTQTLWVQEEPENMGAWRFLRARFGESLFGKYPFGGIRRPPSPSPATGSARIHKKDQKYLVAQAFAEA